MQKVTYIIPIHEYSIEYMEKALKSVKNLKGTEEYYITLVGTKEILDKYKPLVIDLNCPQQVTYFETEETDLFKKINLAVMDCVTPYFSVLEFDDEFYPYWDQVAQEYLEDKRYSILLPMVENKKEDDTVVSLANEIVLDAAFAKENELGLITTSELRIFKDFLTSGAYIKTEEFIRLGGLKSELKIAAWYEYLLNVSYQEDTTIYVVPRIGYKHTVLREGSYLLEAIKTITPEEGQELIKKALENYPETEEEKAQENGYQ